MPATLSDTRQAVERSLFEAIRNTAVYFEYLPDVNQLSQVNIGAVNQGSKTFTLNGVNLTTKYTAGRKFDIIESTLNNGTYTVASSIYQGGNTIITTLESIPDSTANGKASIYIYYDDSVGIALYEAAKVAVVANKGFMVDVFGVGSSRAKYNKKIPRIVIIPNQVLPGALGGDNNPIYVPQGIDPLAPTHFDKMYTPPQTIDLTYDFHLVSSTAEQSRVLSNILAIAIPKRGYVPIINDTVKRFFAESFSYRNMPNPGDNIMEDIYMYKISDVYETNNIISDESIIPINQITIDTDIS
jgi:hypothetical protein